MKKRLLLFLFVTASFCLNQNLYAQACNMAGTYTIGPSGNYATLSAATTALRSVGVGGPVILELKTTYTSSAESTGGISFSSIPCISATNNVTVRPAIGASNLQVNKGITGLNAALINLTNARYITFDGRPGGTGSTIALTIENPSTTTGVFMFSADASFNTLKYLNIKGSCNSATFGLITFLGTTQSITNGNNNNLITNCNIGASTNTPTNCIYAAGTAGKKNTANKIINCNISNYYLSGQSNAATGILLATNNTGWEITGNSFFQTASRGIYSAKLTAIKIDDNSSSGFLVQNNFIGGSASGCSGTAYEYAGDFTGIYINAGTQAYSNIQGNRISNIAWRCTSSPNENFCGIQLVAGKLNCGGVTGNTIGSTTQNNDITGAADYLESPEVDAILASPLPGIYDTVIIKNNLISGITTNPSPSSSYFEIRLNGIYIKSQANGYFDIGNNTIGSTSLTSSLNNTTTGGHTKGIYVTVAGAANDMLSSNIANKIHDNTIANFSDNGTIAISVWGGRQQLLHNDISKITGTGIYMLYGCPGSVISDNRLYSFVNSSTGISAESTGGLIVSGNFIHNFDLVTPPGVQTWIGINIIQTTGNPGAGFLHGNYTISNNMISLGTNPLGSSIQDNIYITGINTPMDNTVMTHNSVYIGSVSGNGADVFGAYIGKFFGGTNHITNNIFANEVYTVTSPVYTRPACIKFEESINALTGLVLSNNIYYCPGTNNYIGSYKNKWHKDFAEWQTVTGLEANSFVSAPGFINAAGDLSSVNLHLNSPAVAESKGILEAVVTDDYDHEVRSGLSPVDIGADAGNYTPAAPVIPYRSLCAGDDTLSIRSSLEGNYYQWQVNTGSGFTDITDNADYSGTTSSVLYLSNVHSSWYGYQFRVLVNFEYLSEVTILKFENFWTGAVNNSWENPANWSCGEVPEGNTDVYINGGSVIVGAPGTCRTLTLLNGAIFTVVSGVSFIITH